MKRSARFLLREPKARFIGRGPASFFMRCMARFTEKSHPLSRMAFSWQGQKDSNPRPLVLETSTLPTELYPCIFVAFLYDQYIISQVFTKSKGFSKKYLIFFIALSRLPRFRFISWEFGFVDIEFDQSFFLKFLLTLLTCLSKSPFWSNLAITYCSKVGTVQE